MIMMMMLIMMIMIGSVYLYIQSSNWKRGVERIEQTFPGNRATPVLSRHEDLQTLKIVPAPIPAAQESPIGLPNLRKQEYNYVFI